MGSPIRKRPKTVLLWTVLLLTAAWFPAWGAAGARPAETGYFVPVRFPHSLYRIDARVDPAAGRVEGHELIELKNDSGRAIDTVALEWDLEAARTLEVTVGGKRLTPRDDEARPSRALPLFFRLPDPLPPGGTLRLEADFRAGYRSSSGDSGLATTAWYPRLWWDGLAGHDSYSVALAAPEGYALAVSGRFNERSRRFEAEGIKSFGLYLARGEKAETVEVEGVRITAVSTEKGRKAAAVCLRTAADAVSFYKKWLGFYPYPFLTIIPGGSGRWGGYPFAPGIVAIHGLETYVDGEPPRHWQHITSHEIGHQYWGEWVLDGDDSSWLWICLGIYADTNYMLTRGFDPDRRAEWMGNYVQAVGSYYDTTLDVPPGQEARIVYDRNNLVVHSKGPAFLNALAVTLGPDEFERIYRKALRAYAGRRLGWREFERFCEAETGLSLDWLFEAWVRGNGYLCYAVEGRDCRPEGNGFRSEIRVKRLGTMAVPVPVRAVFEDGTEQNLLTDRTRVVDTLVLTSPAGLKDVILDPEHRLALLPQPLADIPPDAANMLAWGLDPSESLEVFEALRQTSFDSAPLWYRLGMNLFDQDSYEEAAECFEKVAADPDPDFQLLGPAWLGMVEDLRGNRDKALAHYRAALARDKGRNFGEEQFRLRIDRKWLEARLAAPYSRESALSLPDKPTAEQLITLVEALDWTHEGRNPHIVFEKAKGLDITGAEFWFKLGLLLFDSGFDEESLAAFLKTGAAPDVDGLLRFASYVWQGHLNDLFGRRGDALAAYRKALEVDTGESITHGQYRMVIDRAWVEARLKAPFQWKKRRAASGSPAETVREKAA
jgi:tetratricopeptide (TPR) repeat protein